METNCLIAPTEFGYDLLEIKRALLFYDKVTILTADDRDFFPGNMFSIALGMPPIMSTPVDHVRRMGKVRSYNSDFEQVLDELRPFLDAGTVEVRDSWNREGIPSSMTIGSVDNGGFPLNVEAMLRYYRGIAKSEVFLRAALDKSAFELISNQDDDSFASNGAADGGINRASALPLLKGPLVEETARATLTNIARARISTAIKIWGLSEMWRAVPILPPSSSSIFDELALGVRSSIDALDLDPYWTRRSVLLEVMIGAFISDERLNSLSVEQFFKFRNDAMKRSHQERRELLNDIQQMAAENTNLDLFGFREKVSERLEEYRRSLQKLNDQRREIKYHAFAELTEKSAILGAGHIGGTVLANFSSPVSASITLLLAIAWGARKFKEFRPQVVEALEKERDIEACADFSVFKKLNYIVPS